MKMESPASSLEMEIVDPTTSLPKEIMVTIFHHLTLKDLLRIEQVCLRWKSLVGDCFATKKKLEMRCFSRDMMALNNQWNLLRRCGPALKELTVRLTPDDRIEWFEEIANIFPNLSTISVVCDESDDIGDQRLKKLATNCRKIQNIDILCYKCKDEDLGFLMNKWPGLKSLTIECEDAELGDSLTKLSSNLLALSIVAKSISLPGILHALSLFRNITYLSVENDNQLLAVGKQPKNNQKGTSTGPARWTSIELLELPFPKEIFLQICHFSLLKELRIVNSPHVKDDVLIEIVQCCPQLRKLMIIGLSNVGNRGLSSLSRCRNLVELKVNSIKRISDECLYKISEVGSLQEFCIWWCRNISSQGCEAIVSRCPLLENFNVEECVGVDGNRLVASALKAVESRVNGLVLDMTIRGGLCEISNSNVNHPLLQLTVLETRLNRI